MTTPYGNGEGKVYHVTNIESGHESIYESIKAFEFKKKRKSIILYHPKNTILKKDQATRETPQDSSADDIAKQMNLNKSKSVENAECCFFNTTLYKGRLPDRTPYPLDESKYPFGEIGKVYKRISVPFNVIYESYPICWFWCAVDNQVHYICGREEQQNDIERAILNGYKDENNKEWIDNLKKVENDYLKENKKENEPVEINEESKKELKVDIETKFGIKTIKIISKDKTENILRPIQNDYAREGEKIFYNIAVCGDVLLEKEDIEIEDI